MLRALLILAALAIGLAACATLGLQSTTVSIPRDELTDRLIDGAYLFGRLEQRATDLCDAKAIPDATCQDGARFAVYLKQQFADARVRLRAQGKSIDPQMVLQVLALVGQYGAAAGLNVAKLAPLLAVP